MKKSTVNFLKIMIPLIIVWGVITIFKAGYVFGVWLFNITH